MLYNLILIIVYAAIWPIYRLKIRGFENIPEGGAVVCANHTANIDAVVLFLAFKRRERPAVIAKSELFKTKIADKFFRYMGVFPVNRGKPDLFAIKHSLSILKGGGKLIIFPEGTRVKEGTEESADAKTGAAMMALRTGVPVLPAYITPGKKAFRGCTVTFGKPLYLHKPEIADNAAYRAVTETIMHKIAEMGENIK